MDKIDFKKTMMELYRATSEVERVKPGEGTFLAVDGQGAPGGEAFLKGDSRSLLGCLHSEILSEKRRGRLILLSLLSRRFGTTIRMKFPTFLNGVGGR